MSYSRERATSVGAYSYTDDLYYHKLDGDIECKEEEVKKTVPVEHKKSPPTSRFSTIEELQEVDEQANVSCCCFFKSKTKIPTTKVVPAETKSHKKSKSSSR